jgi:hypothetical protein
MIRSHRIQTAENGARKEKVAIISSKKHRFFLRLPKQFDRIMPSIPSSSAGHSGSLPNRQLCIDIQEALDRPYVSALSFDMVT